MNGQLWQACERPGCESEPVCASCLFCGQHCTCQVAPSPEPSSGAADGYEITSGYVGAFGLRWEPASEEALAAAVAQAVAFNGQSELEIHAALERGAEVRTGQSPNYYYDHSYAAIRRRRR